MASVAPESTGPVTSSSEAPQLLRIPTWIDVSIHGVPAIVLVIGKPRPLRGPIACPVAHTISCAMAVDFFFRENKYRPPVSTWGAVVLSMVAGSAYSVWVEHCASYNNRCKSSFLVFTSSLAKTDIQSRTRSCHRILSERGS